MAETDPTPPADDSPGGEHAAEPTAEQRAAEERAADRAVAEREAEQRTAERQGEDPTAVEGEPGTRPVAAAPGPQPVLQPAEEAAPAAPKREGNRLAGTAWALLAAGLFQVVYLGLIAGFIAVLGGPEIVVRQMPQYFATPFAWLPVLFFFLLFELTVLVFNRAGRFLYVVASLVVGVLVYVLSVLLISLLLRGDIGDRATLEQAFLNPLFVLTGLAAREVMLWTGVAIGARGTRVRRRNRAAQQAYRDELAER